MSWCHPHYVRIFRDERWRPSYVHIIEDHDTGDEDCCPVHLRVVYDFTPASDAALQCLLHVPDYRGCWWTSSET